MGDRARFEGDVGQAVMGNVNEAARLKNVMHVSFAGATPPAPPPPITTLQRSAIAAKVRELVALGDLEQLDVYRVILTEFGAETIAEFPRDQYKAAMARLDGWLAELQPQAGRLAPPVASAARAPIAAGHCAECARHARDARHARWMMALQTVVMLGLTGIFSWMLWNPAAEASALADAHCYQDGKRHSIGSSVKMASGALRECLAGDAGTAPHWGTPVKARGR